jgi:hypothetical protein
VPARRCPNCGLVNPGSAQTCDCGYSFATGEPPRRGDGPSRLNDPTHGLSPGSMRIVIRGTILFVLLAFALGIRLCSQS